MTTANVGPEAQVRSLATNYSASSSGYNRLEPAQDFHATETDVKAARLAKHLAEDGVDPALARSLAEHLSDEIEQEYRDQG
jgi:hypothetical protein